MSNNIKVNQSCWLLYILVYTSHAPILTVHLYTMEPSHCSDKVNASQTLLLSLVYITDIIIHIGYSSFKMIIYLQHLNDCTHVYSMSIIPPQLTVNCFNLHVGIIL